MSNNKQSSVIDWLQAIELERDLTLADWSKAKAMHKVEIVNAVDGFPIHARHMDGEEYYNETFGESC